MGATLAAGQRRLWNLQRLAGDAVYANVVAERWGGPLDVPALAAALSAVVNRHEVLRWRFPSPDGQPSVVVDPPVRADIEVVDLPEAEVETALRADGTRRFDLDTGPLWRFRVLRLGDDRHVTILVAHQLVADLRSLELVWADLMTAYGRARAGLAPGSGDPVPGFAEYAEERRAAESTVDVQWWRRHLDGAPPALDLPRDSARPVVAGHQVAEATGVTPPATRQRLAELAAELAVAPSVLLLAAFTLLVRRQAGHTDLVLATSTVDTPGIVGPVDEFVPLRITIDDGADFAALVRAVEVAQAQAAAHPHAPYDRIVESLALPRDPSRAPLAQVAFAVRPGEPSGSGGPGEPAGSGGPGEPAGPERSGLVARRLDPPAGASPFDLTLWVSPADGGLTVRYRPHLYRPGRVTALLASLVALLEELLARPTRRVAAASARPRRSNLPDPSAPLVGSVRGTGSVGVVERIRRWAAVRPDAVAVDGDGGTLSYAELDELRGAVCQALWDEGVGTRAVAVLTARSVSLPAVLLGVLSSGARWLLLDPAHPASRLAREAAAANVRALVVCPGAAVPAELAGLPTIAVDRLRTAHEQPSAPLPYAQRGYLMATSGTTGEPAVVEMTETPLASFLGWYSHRFRIADGDATALLSGLSYDAMLRDLFATLVVGGRVWVPPAALLRDPDALVTWLIAHRITVAHLTPQLARMVSRVGRSLPKLRLALVAGDTLTDRDVRGLRAIAPRAEVINGYGTAETPQIHAYAVARLSTGEESAPQPVSVGAGIEGSQLVVVGRGGTPAAIGELGEVLIRGRNIATGYLDGTGREGGFTRNPFTADDADRVFRTGDLGRYEPDGSVVLAGRVDAQLKVRGHRVEPGEVEAVLRQHPDVAEAAVVGRVDGAGEVTLAAYIVPRRPGGTVRALRELVTQRLPEFARPGMLMLVPALPLTPNGKLDRAALPDPPLRAAPHVAVPAGSSRPTLAPDRRVVARRG